MRGKPVVMRDADDDLARTRKLGQFARDAVAVLRIEARRRLVGDDDRRIQDQGAGERNALALAA